MGMGRQQGGGRKEAVTTFRKGLVGGDLSSDIQKAEVLFKAHVSSLKSSKVYKVQRTKVKVKNSD